jgi:hypothetical protein
LIGVSLGAESIQLRHHLRQGALDVGDGTLGKELTLLFEAALAPDELFSVEI